MSHKTKKFSASSEKTIDLDAFSQKNRNIDEGKSRSRLKKTGVATLQATGS